MLIEVSRNVRINECIINAFLALKRLTLKLTRRVMLNNACLNQYRNILKLIRSALMFCNIVYS